MTKDEKILEILNSKPTQKIGLDEFYGKQTVINMLNEAINYTRCSLQLKDKYKTIDDIITLADLYEAYPNENNLKILTVNGNLLYFVGDKVIKTTSL